MASLRTRTLKDGTTTYTVLFRAPDERGVKRQTSETFDTAEAATEFMNLAERHGAETARRIYDVRDGSVAPARTVTQLLEEHIENLSGVTVGTRRLYNLYARGVAAHPLGALPADGVRRTDVAAWVRSLEKQGLSGKSIELRHQLLSSAFKRAVLDDELTRNPATGVKIPRTESRPKEFLTPAEFSAIYAVVPDEWKPLIHTLAATGLRIGEALALKVENLHLDGARPRLDVVRTWVVTGSTATAQTGAPKTDKGRRSVSLGGALVEHLRAHTAGRSPDEWVFARPDGSPYDRQLVGNYWRRWRAKSGIAKKPRLHDLRHSHVAWMLDAGMTLDRIRDRLGHASIKVTVDVYGGILPDAMDEMAAASDAALQGIVDAPQQLTAG